MDINFYLQAIFGEQVTLDIVIFLNVIVISQKEMSKGRKYLV